MNPRRRSCPVVRNSRFLAVQFSDGRKVAAEIITLDSRYDVAVLKVRSR